MKILKLKKKFLSLAMAICLMNVLHVPVFVSANPSLDTVQWDDLRVRVKAMQFDLSAGQNTGFYDNTPDTQEANAAIKAKMHAGFSLLPAYSPVEVIGLNLSGNPDCMVSSVELDTNEWLRYTFRVPEAGDYRFGPTVATAEALSMSIKVNDGAEQQINVPKMTVVRDSGYNFQDYRVYNGYETWVTLQEGENTIIVKNTGALFLMEHMDFTKGYVLDGELSTAVSGAPNFTPRRSFGGGSYAMTAGGSMEWAVNLREDGLYSIGIINSGGDTDITASLSVDGAANAVNYTKSTNGNPAIGGWQWTPVANAVELEAGTHTVRLAWSSGAGIQIDAVVLTRTGNLPPWETKRIEAENFDLKAGNNVGYYDTTPDAVTYNTEILAAQTAYYFGSDTSYSPVEVRRAALNSNAGMTQYWVEMEPTEWLSYTVNASEAGTYQFAAVMQSASAVTCDIIVNGETTYQVSKTDFPIAGGTAWNFNNFSSELETRIELKQGVNTIRVKNSGNAPVLFDKFLLSKSYIIEGEHGTMTGQGTSGANSSGFAPHQSGAAFYNVQPGTITEWKVTLPAGKYEALAQGFTSLDGCVWNLSVDGNEELLVSGTIPNAGAGAAPANHNQVHITSFGTLEFSEGENTLKLVNFSNSVLGFLDCIILRPVVEIPPEFTVDDFYIADEAGSPATELRNARSVVAELTQLESTDKMCIYVAEYTAEGKLAAIAMASESLEGKAAGPVTVTAPFTPRTDNAGGYVKALLANGKLQPVCKPVLMNHVSKDLYVDAETGNDAGSGDSDAPFQTLARAKEEVARLSADMAGDIVVNIAPGDYAMSQKEVFSEEHGGHNGCRVVYKGTDPENPPVINGGTEITGWTEAENGVWKASAANITDTRTLYVNGEPARRAVQCEIASRGSQMGAEFGTNGKGDDFYTNGSGEVVGILVPSSVTVSEAAVAKGDVDALMHFEFNCSRFRVKQIVPNAAEGKNALVFEKEDFDAERASVGGGIFTTSYGTIHVTLENAKEFVNEPGEFYFDKAAKEIYYYPRTGENLGTAEVYAGTCEQLFSVKGASKESKVENIVFDNLDFRYGAWNGASAKGSVRFNQADQLKSMDKNAPDFMPAQLEIENAAGVFVQNCRFSCLGSNAISMYNAVTDSYVLGNVFRDSSAGAVSIGSWFHLNAMPAGEERCSGITVKNNVIRRMAQEYPTCCAVIGYYVNNVKILHNDIEDLPYTGISLGWGWGSANVLKASNNVIADNRIVDISKFLTDGAHIYTLDRLRGSVISGNYCVKSGDTTGRGGIYLDQGSGYLTIKNNVIEMQEDKSWLFARAMSNNSQLRQIVVTDNFSDNNVTKQLDTTNVSITNHTVKSAGEEWPAAAQAIIANAGVETPYKNLVTQAD